MKSLQRWLGCLAAAVLALSGSGTAYALNIGVFGDVGFQKQEGSAGYFRIGHIDFFLYEDITEDTRVFIEIELLTDPEQSPRPRQFEIEAQRYWIMREFSEAFSIGAGRFHTPIGYWSRQFHHGKLMKPTVTRPFILGFERSRSAFLPMHMIGFLAEGELGAGFHYEAGIANSAMMDTAQASRRLLEVPNRADRSAGKSFFGRLSHDDFGIPFKTGFSVMRNDVNENATGGGQNQSSFGFARGDTLVTQTLFGVDLRYEIGDFDLLAEVYRLRNDAQPGVGGGGSHDATAWFAQFSYRLTDRLLATWRYEALDFDEQDPYFTDPNLLGRTTPGKESRNVYALRYDFHESNALKLELSEHPFRRGKTAILSWEFVMF